MNSLDTLEKTLSSGAALTGSLAGCTVYPRSVHRVNGALLFMARSATGRFLVAAGDTAGFEGEALAVQDAPAKKCPLTYANARRMMELLPFTAPKSHRGHAFTMGLGDRLGLASPGHIRTIEGRGVFPVLAQQSMRELKLTGRTYEDVLAAAAFAVLQEGWQGGWGADGDHLKTAEEIRYALGCGFTMITLDCSEQIDKQAQGMGGAALDEAYAALPEDVRSHYESRYMGKTFALDGGNVAISTAELKSITLTYARAIDYAAGIYHSEIKTAPHPVDFEVSIDETLSTTTPAAHFAVANELTSRGVTMSSMAPRFVGEFQKGIDYIGNLKEFEEHFIVHERIARHFGYKLSIHSGSDKFAVFGAIGCHTGLNVHVKTAGTNWLEALRIVAARDPKLFRELLAFALRHLNEARAYYHIGADPARVADAAKVPDNRLGEYLNQDDARQVLHITYGLMLQAADESGKLLYKDRLYGVLHEYEEEYAGAIIKHIGRHVDAVMGIK